MTKREIVTFLFKWKATISGCLLLVLLTVSMLAYFMPPVYVAKSVILVEGNRAPSIRSELVHGLDMAAVMNTEVKILLSRSVIEAVIDEIKPHEIQGRESWISKTKDTIRRVLVYTGLIPSVDHREAWVKTLQNDIIAEPIAMSHVMEVTFAHQDPKLATDLVNAVTNNYITQHIEVYADLGIDIFYQKQAAQAKEKLDKLSAELDAYKAKFSIPAIADMRGSLSKTLGDLNSQENKLRSDLIELSERFDNSHPTVVLEKKKLTALRNNVRDIQSELKSLDRHESEVAMMESLIDSHNSTYLQYVDLRERAQMNDLANASTTNVRVVEYASLPSIPEYSRLFYISLAFFGGLGLAFSIAIVREYFDRRIENSDLAEQLLGLPVLGAVPFHGTKIPGHRK